MNKDSMKKAASFTFLIALKNIYRKKKQKKYVPCKSFPKIKTFNFLLSNHKWSC